MTAAELKGQRALQTYWRASGVSLPYADLEKLLTTRTPDFLKQFGNGITYSELSETRVNELMVALAKKNYGKWPDPRETGIFFDALTGELGSLSYKIGLVQDAVKATAEDVVSAAKVGLSAYAAVGAIGLLIVILSYRKGK